MTTSAIRYHDISVGHRVAGHESKCANLHGHNYRVHFEIAPRLGFGLDTVGRVLDFSVIKERLCQWLEEEWDHKFLAWNKDELMRELMPSCQPTNGIRIEYPMWQMMAASIVWVPFNPTAENMARYLVEVLGPDALEGTQCVLKRVVIEETRKCSVAYEKESPWNA